MEHDITENLKRIRFNIDEAKAKYRKSGDEVRLMAVTKTVPYRRVNLAVEEGVTLLGENRVQEYLEKKDFYDKRAETHFIGHLQSNKVKYIIDSVTMIHSVDSGRLAAEIDRQAAKVGTVMNVLLEVNIGREESKSGVSPDRLKELVYEAERFKNIRVKGLMTIPPPDKSEEWFYRMSGLFGEMKSERFENADMDILSMGMSADYALAVKYGSNIVRIGSGIFGARKYREEEIK
ncbi:MAG: YggS family pyridoxal phosphate-dependent enzyme [Ruminococcus sp.]|nr:YggS family pyridoxal phosphate-dependent enzyme [Ruminococcus sp.]MCM1480069.1 YggS family pyridoxal phosphate-dependent enzyme [Muribaculaceae bacterium]